MRQWQGYCRVFNFMSLQGGIASFFSDINPTVSCHQNGVAQSAKEQEIALDRILTRAFGDTHTGLQFRWRVLVVETACLLRRSVSERERKNFSPIVQSRTLRTLVERLNLTSYYGCDVPESFIADVSRVRRLSLASCLVHHLKTDCTDTQVPSLLLNANEMSPVLSRQLPPNLAKTVELARKLRVQDVQEMEQIDSAILQHAKMYSSDALRAEIEKILNTLCVDMDWHAAMHDLENDIETGELVRISDLVSKGKKLLASGEYRVEKTNKHLPVATHFRCGGIKAVDNTVVPIPKNTEIIVAIEPDRTRDGKQAKTSNAKAKESAKPGKKRDEMINKKTSKVLKPKEASSAQVKCSEVKSKSQPNNVLLTNIETDVMTGARSRWGETQFQVQLPEGNNVCMDWEKKAVHIESTDAIWTRQETGKKDNHTIGGMNQIAVSEPSTGSKVNEEVKSRSTNKVESRSVKQRCATKSTTSGKEIYTRRLFKPKQSGIIFETDSDSECFISRKEPSRRAKWGNETLEMNQQMPSGEKKGSSGRPVSDLKNRTDSHSARSLALRRFPGHEPLPDIIGVPRSCSPALCTPPEKSRRRARRLLRETSSTSAEFPVEMDHVRMKRIWKRMYAAGLRDSAEPKTYSLHECGSLKNTGTPEQRRNRRRKLYK